MKYLLRTVESYRVANENEAKALIEDAKHDSNFSLIKYLSEYKCKKVRSGEFKGEIEEEWYKVTLTKEFTDEKEPTCTATIAYNVELGAFPDPIDDDDEEEEE